MGKKFAIAAYATYEHRHYEQADPEKDTWQASANELTPLPEGLFPPVAKVPPDMGGRTHQQTKKAPP